MAEAAAGHPGVIPSAPSGREAAGKYVTERFRITRAFWLAIVGLGIAAALVVALLVAGWADSKDIVAVVGLFTSVLGTLVGAFFGVQIGSAGKEKLEDQAETAQKKMNAVLAHAPDTLIEAAKTEYPDLFK